MELPALLGIRPGVTAVMGSGGKTTLLRTLGEALAAEGRRVLLCATTKLYPFEGLPNLLDSTEEALAEAIRAARIAGMTGKELQEILRTLLDMQDEKES